MRSNISEAQLNANRQNAQLSTGPKSEEGKKKVKQNPVRHGFAGMTVFIPEHEVEAFRKRLEQFREEFHPKGPSEEVLVQSLADLSWSAEQLRAQCNNFMSLLGSFGAEGPTPADPRTAYAMTQANGVSANMQTMNLYGIYEQRKMRLFNSTRRELVQVQAERKAAEKEELEAAAAVRQVTKTAQSKWVPVEDGFACSVEEIDRFIARRDRINSVAACLKQAS